MSNALKIGIVGGSGWLGQAISSALLDTGAIKAHDLTVSYRGQKSCLFPGIYQTADNQELVDRSDIIILSVRPADWQALRIEMPGKLVISVMAGITLERLCVRHNAERVVRAMPNAAAVVGQSYTPWAATSLITDTDRVVTRSIFAACGVEDEINTESHIDYFTGLSGSGPAFPAMLASVMMDEAVAHGIPSELALRAVTILLTGTGRLLEQNKQTPQEIVASFANYDGTTAAALNAMKENGFDTALAKGLSAAFLKSMEMEASY